MPQSPEDAHHDGGPERAVAFLKFRLCEATPPELLLPTEQRVDDDCRWADLERLSVDGRKGCSSG